MREYPAEGVTTTTTWTVAIDGGSRWSKVFIGFGKGEEMSNKKCKMAGCFNDADCNHGYCYKHCSRHGRGEYNKRLYPKSRDAHIGVEIEVLFSDDSSFRRGLGVARGHYDGSLTSCYSAEFKVLSKSERAASRVEKIVRRLWERGAYVNGSCGFHVHVDVRQLSWVRKMMVIDWLKATEDYWFSLVPQRRRDGNYTQRIGYDYDSHYSWANLTRYGSLEIRIHPGTVNPHKARAWIMAMVHLQKKILSGDVVVPENEDGSPAESPENMFWNIFGDAPEEVREYILVRRQRGGVLRDEWRPRVGEVGEEE